QTVTRGSRTEALDAAGLREEALISRSSERESLRCPRHGGLVELVRLDPADEEQYRQQHDHEEHDQAGDGTDKKKAPNTTRIARIAPRATGIPIRSESEDMAA